ncbi:unnamed protein product [Adineta ricciae]|uniref:Uncharacterized protein n=1 Tax=Adineta ricciae TaxID=249248 RepID=A0A814BTI7_ADIRI|nr:unnamed protein product [Adineta ricciae]CAF1025166.1 unnamed protein product [Adineta ricciae]
MEQFAQLLLISIAIFSLAIITVDSTTAAYASESTDSTDNSTNMNQGGSNTSTTTVGSGTAGNSSSSATKHQLQPQSLIIPFTIFAAYMLPFARLFHFM